MENTTQNSEGRVQFGLRMEADLYGAIVNLASVEDRSISNQIQRLLKQSPEVQAILKSTEVETQIATV